MLLFGASPPYRLKDCPFQSGNSTSSPIFDVSAPVDILLLFARVPWTCVNLPPLTYELHVSFLALLMRGTYRTFPFRSFLLTLLGLSRCSEHWLKSEITTSPTHASPLASFPVFFHVLVPPLMPLTRLFLHRPIVDPCQPLDTQLPQS